MSLLAVNKGLRQHLLDDPLIVAVVGNRIVAAETAPREMEYPLVLFTLASARDLNRAPGVDETDLIISVKVITHDAIADADKADMDAALTIYDLIHARLQKSKFEVVGMGMSRCRRDFPFKYDEITEGRVYFYAGGNYRVTVNT